MMRWIQEIRALSKRISKARVDAYAAQSAFYLIMGFIPFIMLLLTLLQYTTVTKTDAMELLMQIFPVSFQGFLEDIVSEIYVKSTTVMSISVIAAVWACGRGVLAITNGLNSVNGLKETRNYLFRRIRSGFYVVILVLSIVLALVGVFLITTHGSLTGLAVSPAALVSGIVSACCVAIYTMWPKKLQEQYPTPMLQGWAFLMGGIMFSLIFRPWQIDYVPTAMGAFGIFIVVVLGNVLAFSLYMSGVPLIGPQKASLYSFAEPVTAAIISTLVLGSSFTLWDALGFGCIFLMLVLLSLPAKQKN